MSIIFAGLIQLGLATPRFEQLDNGLRVIVIEEHALPLVSVQLWYHAGSACDSPEYPGLCELARTLLECHADTAKQHRATGLRYESRVLSDATYFATELPPCFLDYVLDIEAARMQIRSISEDKLAFCLQNATTHYSEVVDDPEQITMRHLLAAMLLEHRHNSPPVFVRKSLEQISADDVNAFLHKWFGAGNTTLLIIGDVSTDKVLSKVRNRFGRLDTSEPVYHEIPPHLPAESITIQVPIPGELVFAWRTPPMGYFENAAIDVLMQRLCNQIDGPLCQRLLILGCSPPRWERYSWRDAGILIMALSPHKRVDHCGEQNDKIAEIIEDELSRTAREGSTEIEHNRARALATRAIRLETAGFSDRARYLARCQVVGGDLVLANFQLSRIAGVGIPDVQQAAAFLSNTRRVYLLPGQPGENPDPPASLPATQIRQPYDAENDVICSTAVPRLVPPHLLPRITAKTDPHLTVKVCRLASSPTATVITRVRPVATLPGNSTQNNVSKMQRPEIADYFSYHGMTLEPLTDTGFMSTCASSRVEAAIEWHRRLLDPDETGNAGLEVNCAVEISYVGPLTMEDIYGLALEYWPPPTDSSRKPASHRFSDFNINDEIQVECSTDQQQAGVIITIKIDFPKHSAAPVACTRLHLDTLAGLLEQLSNDSDHLCSWTTHENTIQASLCTSVHHWKNAVTAVWTNIRKLRRGECSLTLVESALNHARIESWVKLDSTEAIAKALLNSGDNPWNVHPELDAQRFLDTIGPQLQSSPVLVHIQSPTDLAEAANELAADLNNDNE